MAFFAHGSSRRQKERALSLEAGSGGNTDQITFPNVEDVAGQGWYTLSAWTYADNATATQSEYIFNIQNSASSQARISIGYNGSNFPMIFYRIGGAGSFKYVRYATAGYTSGQWVHNLIVFNHDSSNPPIGNWYENGVELSTRTTFNGAGAPDAADGPWGIGNQGDGGLRNWDGDIYQLAVWKGLLPDDVRNQLYRRRAHPMNFEKAGDARLIFCPVINNEGVVRDPVSGNRGTTTIASGGLVAPPFRQKPLRGPLRYLTPSAAPYAAYHEPDQLLIRTR